MRSRTVVLLLALAAAPAVRAAPVTKTPAAPSRAGFKLKPGAEGKLCLDCHGDFEERLKKAFVHTPVRSRNCIGCHNPHASDHGKLLAASGGAICATCHSVVPASPKSTHRPVAEGRCIDCHDPHASPNKFNLVRDGNALCGGCHQPITDQAANSKRKHKPVEQGCTTCHQPHGSGAASLLKADVPGLCLGCHKLDKPAYVKAHAGYPVQKGRCTSCHDPHGSNSPGMLYNAVHPPVAKGMCSMCHEAPTSKTPFATKQAGVTLCKGCHNAKVTQFMDRNRIHEPVAQGSCLACHGPHGAKKAGLLRAGMVTVCGKCHSDTIRRQDLSPTKHKPIAEGQCTSCHDPHAGDAGLLLLNPNRIELCGTCHDWQKHSSHPIGEAKRDPRNPNGRMECLSCHRAHGTEYKHMLPFAKTTDMCTKCHEQFKR